MQLAQATPRAPIEGSEVINDVVTIQGAEYIFQNIVSILLALAGIILLIMLFEGGFRYITSGGDPKGTESAKKTLTYAIGGLVLVVLAFLFLRYVAEFTGAPITTFSVTN